jgi:hypothetical protein
MTCEEFIEMYGERLQKWPILIQFTDRNLYAGNPKEIADKFVKSLGFKALGEKWINLDWEYHILKGGQRSDPIVPLTQFLNKSMAYDEEIFNLQEATKIASDFYNVFGFGKRSRFTNNIGYGWHPITTSTFEAVHVAMDDKNIGILLIEDED